MSNLSFLEDFASETPSAAAGSQDGGATSNELRLSFDDGYKCGWQDGSTATENKDREVQDALSSALQAMNFTYFEARQHAM
jgi:flagellar assembly protein FliH